MSACRLRDVTKRFGASVALDSVTVAVPRASIVGLIGRNGSGKSTLIRLVAGLYLPDVGECETLGQRTQSLGGRELARMGLVDQHTSLIESLTGEQLLRYVSRFYPTWDRELERRLVRDLELDPSQRAGAMSPGNRQKLALVLATSHHPELLLLDEPLGDLDPIARQAVLLMLLERFSSDDITVVISSHMLRDIEPVVNRIVCLERGRVTAAGELDAVREQYAEWLVTSPSGRLPASYPEPWVLTSRGDRFHARLLVRTADTRAAAFGVRYEASVESTALPLEQLFPLLIGSGKGGASPRPHTEAGV